MEEPLAAPNGAVEAPATSAPAAPVATTERPVSADIDTRFQELVAQHEAPPTPEAPPKPAGSDLSDDDLLAALKERTHLGHDHFKQVPAYNQILNKSINEGRLKDRQEFTRNAAFRQNIAQFDAGLAQLKSSPEGAQSVLDHMQAGTRFNSAFEKQTDGFTIAEWVEVSNKLKAQPQAEQNAQAEIAYQQQITAQAKGLLAQHEFFKDVDLDQAMVGDTLPDKFVALAVAAVKKERAAIEDEVEARVNRKLTALHMTGDEMPLLPSSDSNAVKHAESVLASSRSSLPEIEDAYFSKYGFRPPN